MVLLKPTLPAIPILVSYITGMLLYTCRTPPRQEWVHILCAVAFLGACLAAFYRALSPSVYYFRTAFLLTGCCCIGYSITAYRDAWQDPHFIGHHLAQADRIRVRLEDDPAEKQKTYLLPAQVTGYYKGDSLYKANGKVNIYLYKHDSIPLLRAGTTITLPQQLVRIQNSGNPHAFDFAQYAAYQQLYFQGFYAYKDILKTEADHQIPVLLHWRTQLTDILRKNIKDQTTQSVVLAMLLNERALLHDDIWKAYAATGIVHIISISGMHIQVFLFMVLFLLRWLKHPRYKWIKYVTALVLVWTYILLTNSPPSAVRAGIMFSLTSIALFTEKEEAPLNSLAATALLMLLLQPYWLFNLGMQLSFLCMLSIFTFYQPIRNLIFFRNRVLRSLWEGIALSIAVQVWVTPAVIYYFHQFPLWVVLVNLPAGIYSFILMAGGLVIMAAGYWIEMSWLGNLLTGVTTLFNKLVFFFAGVTPRSLSHFAIDGISAVLLTLVLLSWARYLCIRRTRTMLLAGIAGSCILMLDQYFITAGQAGQDKLVVYRSNGYSLTQKVQGFQGYVYAPDTADAAAGQLLLAPCLHWSLQHPLLPLEPNTLFRWKDRTALILTAANLRPQAVDILIIPEHVAFDPGRWASQFNPRLVVLDGSFTRRKSKKWVEALNNYNFAVYSVVLQGALVLE